MGLMGEFTLKNKRLMKFKNCNRNLTKSQRKKKTKKKKRAIGSHGSWDNCKQPNIHIIGVSKRGGVREKIF
jgi:hypothetical protein